LRAEILQCLDILLELRNAAISWVRGSRTQILAQSRPCADPATAILWLRSEVKVSDCLGILSVPLCGRERRVLLRFVLEP
jgi:hypothetical protein